MSDTEVPRVRQLFLRRNRFLRILGIVLVLAAIASASASFLILTGATPVEPDPSLWPFIWLVNGVLILMVIALLLTEAYLLLQSRLNKQAGSGLHVRLVSMFAVAAAVPAFIVAVVATIALNQGLDHWFSERSRAMVESSRSVANSYLSDQAAVLRNEILSLASELEKINDVFVNDQASFTDIFTSLAQSRSLPFAYILNDQQVVVLRARLPSSSTPPTLPSNLIEDVVEKQPDLIRPGRDNLVGAVIKLTGYDNYYLFVARGVDPQVLEYTRLAEQNVAEYREYESNRLVFQITFAFMYVGLAFVVLLAAVWLGIALANRLVAPIRNLMVASTKVSEGELDIRVPVKGVSGDMFDLSSRFNRMTSQLRAQHGALLSANETIDQRRQFTEAVLEGVSAGIVGLDPDGVVTIVNASAAEMFESKPEKLVGKQIVDVVPALSEFVSTAMQSQREQNQEQVEIKSKLGEERTYQARITREGTNENSKGYVITLDDISDLIAAQRTSVWADVAQRIAHEIKNPLTPIQLSAERLRRRYRKKLDGDFDVFDKCTDTIMRQVGDIGRMVDEFSTFARMPSANLASANLKETIKQAVFSESVRHPEIKIKTELPDEDLVCEFDERLISQVLTNLIKNASEALEGTSNFNDRKPMIVVRSQLLNGHIEVSVQDNGPGWPSENRSRLLEPYMTTRGKGTGLGLAIVSKIIEQHGGQVELLDGEPDESGNVGACFRFTLLASPAPKTKKNKQDKNQESTEITQAVDE
ncbi:sensor histidine kinase NtrY-like [Maritalea porphyrae]|uniref:histidine kinase n=1 Tax=Maritalea porphyrae TaxID=880732 RepID=A0ABQ5UV59_9HYPH|nr:PAS domain-containing sensor histidine kinase [Maritalea porphyrae]GLQ18443.1 two-component sensor histidine kinase [Maritalea porphyrae]